MRKSFATLAHKKKEKGKTAADALPESKASPDARPAPILGVPLFAQRSVGAENFWQARVGADVPVQRQDASGGTPQTNFQLTPPSILQPPAPLLPPSEYQFQLSPETEAMMREQILELVSQMLNPEQIRAAVLQFTMGRLAAADPTAPAAEPPVTSPQTPPAPSTPPPLDIPTPGPGSAGAALPVIMSTPVFKELDENLLSDLKDKLGLPSLAMVAGAVTVTVTDAQGREELDEVFSGLGPVVIPILGTPLSVEFNFHGDTVMLGLYLKLDDLPFFPDALGFGSSEYQGPDPMSVPLPEQSTLPQVGRSAEPGAGDALPAESFGQLGRRILAASSGGSLMSDDVRERLEDHLGADLSGVRLHTDGEADRLARSVHAVAFTTGQDIFLRAGAYDPDSREGMRLLAHEVVHTQQQASGPVAGTPIPGGVAVSHPSDSFEREADRVADQITQGRGSPPALKVGARAEGGRPVAGQHRSVGGNLVLSRQTPQEVRDRFTNWGGLNLREEALGDYLLGQVRAGRYQFVMDVINVVNWSNRDEVAGQIVRGLRTRAIIGIGRDASGAALLRLMRNEIGDWWGFITRGEARQADLLGAVLDEPGKRASWNRERIGVIKGEAGSDLETLARVFEDAEIIDDDTVQGRLQSVLGATEHVVIPGLQTGIEFSDTGFAGDQNPGGAGFRDPHPSSRNQVGHFMTAVGLEFSPGVVSRPIALFGSIRSMVGAPAGMSDADVALRLTIGHEKAPDPNSTMAAVNVVLTGILASLIPGPEGETEEERDRRIDRAVSDETQRQINEIIAGFRTQFNAATDADVQAWNDALNALGTGDTLNLSAAEAPLRRVQINFQNQGSSIQDLRLSLVGWRLGQLIGNGAFGDDRARVAGWIRTNLGPQP
ncbi:MAG TPA: DUF4157 domain-containing protein [Pyrinomonadaceae bacterium]|nr:DUF4157 domain-containing protein [Pyrinomonadaceae bacterium]